jgi:hypothetical protein
MRLIDRFKRPSADKNQPTVVAFAGGMGTQIIQAAVYFSLKKTGRPVYADLSYFATDARMAEVGNPGQLTHWFWQLDQFGLPQSSFEQKAGLNKRNADIIHDGARMVELGLKALAEAEIQQKFQDISSDHSVLPDEVWSSFLCIHIRRGDYVNVASHLIQDTEFISLINKFSGLVKHAVILSDSPIKQDFRDAVFPSFASVFFLDNIDPYSSHRVMRNARILICSNSTFSLTAATLNPSALVIIPKRWFAEKDHAIEAPIHALCTFQIMK